MSLTCGHCGNLPYSELCNCPYTVLNTQKPVIHVRCCSHHMCDIKIATYHWLATGYCKAHMCLICKQDKEFTSTICSSTVCIKKRLDFLERKERMCIICNKEEHSTSTVCSSITCIKKRLACLEQLTKN